MQLHVQISDMSIVCSKGWERRSRNCKAQESTLQSCGEKWKELKQFVDELQQEIDEPCQGVAEI
jgi:hypothetical protein